ncbi:MAG: BON domain-containing protein [Steroidobacteraceae bacterium]|jgi:osmotically-inducible protein OsmY
MPRWNGTRKRLPRRSAFALIAWASVVVSICDLSGCAAYHTYQKCGLQGCPGDAAITAEVRSRLYHSSFLEPSAIRVQTLDHVVFLDGVVASGLEIGAAESITLQVPGVARVVNSIVVSTAR